MFLSVAGVERTVPRARTGGWECRPGSGSIGGDRLLQRGTSLQGSGISVPWLLAEDTDMGATDSVPRSRLESNISSSPFVKSSNDTHLL